MEVVNTDTGSPVGLQKKINTLISLGAGKIIENTLNRLIDLQVAKYRRFIKQTNRELEKFEVKYNMASGEFFRKFEAGEMDDADDFFEWGGLYVNVLLYSKHIEELESLVNESR